MYSVLLLLLLSAFFFSILHTSQSLLKWFWEIQIFLEEIAVLGCTSISREIQNEVYLILEGAGTPEGNGRCCPCPC